MDKINIFHQLEKIIAEKKSADQTQSYTAQLLHGDIDHLLKKVGEEAVEVVIAGKGADRKQIIYETADLMYHLMVLLNRNSISLNDIQKELSLRFHISGLEEKASRNINLGEQ